MATKKIESDAVETVTVVVPREAGGETTMFLALNGKPYNVPRGKPVELPKDVADVYFESLRAGEIAENTSDEFHRDMNIIQGAPY